MPVVLMCFVNCQSVDDFSSDLCRLADSWVRTHTTIAIVGRGFSMTLALFRSQDPMTMPLGDQSAF
jgi:hypothetical protein